MGKMKQMMDKMTGKGEDSLPDVDTSADDAFLRQVNHDEGVPEQAKGEKDDGDSKAVY